MSKKIFLIILFILILTNPANSEVLQATLADSTGVIGLDMSVGLEPVPIVKNVFKGGPSEKAGLKPGDRILAINNTSTRGLSSGQIDISISDVPGTRVLFTVLRGRHIFNTGIMVVPLHQANQDLRQQFLTY